MQANFLALPRLAKQGIVMALDVFLGVTATWMALSLRFDELFWPSSEYQWSLFLICPALSLPIFIKTGLYRAVFRYTGDAAFHAIFRAAAFHSVFLTILIFFKLWPMVPISLGILQPVLLLIFVAFSRAVARYWLGKSGPASIQNSTKGRFLIYGAASLGVQVAVALKRSEYFQLIGFVDDDPEFLGRMILGQRVYAATDIPRLISDYDVTDILIAIPSLTQAQRLTLLEQLCRYKVHLRLLPNLEHSSSAKLSVSEIHEINIEDLLGREPVPPDASLMKSNIFGKVVLVTGAGGSIGSELCRQIINIRPCKLLLLDHNEFGLYTIHADLVSRLGSCKVDLVPIIGSVRDYTLLSNVMRTWHPNTVYHAAAYKHVPLVEHNVVEGIRNNVFGTLAVARAALENGADNFVLISTDKAVRPTNVMGASKRLAEMLLQALAAEDKISFENEISVHKSTKFSMVRFGNALGSSGSVVPLFSQQIRDGGPVTVTHAEVTRYFMTIPEAAQLVIQAGAMGGLHNLGGHVFVLDMGEPVKIIDLAKKMIELSGLTVRSSQNPHGDIDISVTGLRPGEKLYEELLIGGNAEPTQHCRIMKANEDYLPWKSLSQHLVELDQALQDLDLSRVQGLLTLLVSGYQATPTMVDWVSSSQKAHAS